MRLEGTDTGFFQLWFPLLDFVNRKYHVRPNAGRIDKRHGVYTRDAMAIAKRNHEIHFSI